MTQPTPSTRDVVDAYYQAGVRGELTAFAPLLAPEFAVTAPNYLPWGGTHPGAEFFADEVLPSLPDVLDFARFAYEEFVVDGERAVALITIGVTGTAEVVKISEHWVVTGGLARSLWVAYFEPQPLLAKLGIAHGLGG